MSPPRKYSKEELAQSLMSLTLKGSVTLEQHPTILGFIMSLNDAQMEVRSTVKLSKRKVDDKQTLEEKGLGSDQTETVKVMTGQKEKKSDLI